MNKLTVRGFDDALSSKVSQLAEREGISLSKAALKLMRKGAGLTEGDPMPRKPIGHALDHLAGTWTREEFDEFTKAVEVFETVDEAAWL